MFRQESHHASAVEPTEKHRRRRPAWRREVRPEAVLSARRLIGWGHLGRQEVPGEAVERQQAIWGARGPSGGRLGGLSQNAGFAQAAGMGASASQVPNPQRGHRRIFV